MSQEVFCALYDGEFYISIQVDNEVHFENQIWDKSLYFICGIYGFPIIKYFDTKEIYEIKGFLE